MLLHFLVFLIYRLSLGPKLASGGQNLLRGATLEYLSTCVKYVRQCDRTRGQPYSPIVETPQMN